MSTYFQPPLYWQQFEELTEIVARTRFPSRNAMRYGRSGQRQNGVDILVRSGGKAYGIQCKRLKEGSDKLGGGLSETIIRTEAAKAEKFPIKLDEFIIATTLPDSAQTTHTAFGIGTEYLARDLFDVSVWGWDTFVGIINTHHQLKRWYYPAVVDAMSANRLDTTLVDGIREAFNRPAFEVTIQYEQPAEFFQAIKDVQKQLRTGHLFDRTTRLTMRQTVGGYDKLNNPALRRHAERLNRELRLLRRTIDNAFNFEYDRGTIVGWTIKDALSYAALESVRARCSEIGDALFVAAGLAPLNHASS
jgi:hypothetical protein